MQRRLVALRQQRGQGDQAVGEVVADRAGEEFGPAIRKLRQHRRPVRTELAAGTMLADLVQDQRLGLGRDHALQRRPRRVVDAVGGECARQRALRAAMRPDLDLAAQPATQRVLADDDGVRPQRRRRRGEIARPLASCDQHAQPVPPFVAQQLAEKELRLAETTDARGVDLPPRGQRAVDGVGVERPDGHVADGQRDVVGALQRVPLRLALCHPRA